MFGRIDNAKNQTGLALCKNNIPLPHGPVTKRPGTRFVNVAQASATAVRLVPFVFSASQSMVLEFGHQYIRFHTDGGTLLNTAVAVASIAGNTVNTTGAHGMTTGDTAFVGTMMSGAFTSGRFVVVTVVDADTVTVADPITGDAVTPAGTDIAEVYSIASPYDSADLFGIRFTQDADVLTLTSQGYTPRELRRLGATNWTLTAPSLGAAVTAPGTPTVVVTAGTGTPYNKNVFYKITTITSDGLEESLTTSPSTAASNDLTLAGAKNTISYTAPGGVTTPSYRVYKAINTNDRLYGFIGETTGLTFVDDNIAPDYSRNPPSSTIRLDTASNYPAAVTYYEQRRVFAGTTNSPQGIFMTRSGTESNLNVSNPVQSGDAIQIRIKAQQQNAIRHLLPLTDLLALTAGGVWRVFATSNGALLPSNIAARPQSYDGVSEVTPLLTGSAAIFVEATGKRVRDIGYSNDSQGYVTDDRSIMAPHLFNDYTLVDACFQRNPDKVAWFVRSDGVLLSMTYLPEQQVFAWAQHDTDGVFESVCSVPENGQDRVYAVVRRTLDGQQIRCIEQMASRQFSTIGSAFFVDCGATYSGSPTTTISGLWHLAGQEIVALADGGVLRELTVSSTGSVTLPIAASLVQLGLPYTGDVQTLPLGVEAAAAGGQGTIKNIGQAYLLVNRTGVLQAGPDEDNLLDIPLRSDEPYDSPPNLKSEELDVTIENDWTTGGQMWVRSADPVPFTLSSITLKVTLAG
jgi:hypothetical protein